MPLLSGDAYQSTSRKTSEAGRGAGAQTAIIGATRVPSLTRSSLVGVDVVEHRLNVVAVCQAAFPLSPLKDLGSLIVPASFSHEFAPNVDLLLVWSSTS